MEPMRFVVILDKGKVDYASTVIAILVLARKYNQWDYPEKIDRDNQFRKAMAHLRDHIGISVEEWEVIVSCAQANFNYFATLSKAVEDLREDSEIERAGMN